MTSAAPLQWARIPDPYPQMSIDQVRDLPTPSYLEIDDPLRFDPKKLQFMCGACHRMKTARQNLNVFV